MPIDRFPNKTPSEQTVKTQIREGRRFLENIGYSANQFLNESKRVADDLLHDSGYSEGVQRRISAGIYRIFEGSEDIVSMDEIYTRLDEKEPPRPSYNALIGNKFPPYFFDEKLEGKTSNFAYIGHYIDENRDVAEVLDDLEIGEGKYDYIDLANRFQTYFPNAHLMQEDFKDFSDYRVAFRVSFVGYKQVNDEGEYERVEKFLYIPFSDSADLLITELRKLANVDFQRAKYGDNNDKTPIINWILPLYPFTDSENFLSEEFGKRAGFYCYYRTPKMREE